MAVFVLVVSACGGDASNRDTAATSTPDPPATEVADSAAIAVSAERLVESADGQATLLLPAGSLPEGLSADDVQLELLLSESTEPGLPVLAVQLLPDGLVLTGPATLTVALPEALEGGLMAIHMSGDAVEFLVGGIQPWENGFSFRTSVGHFSAVWFYIGTLFFELEVEVAPERVSTGQTQRAAGDIVAKTDPVALLLRFGSDPSGTWRQLTFSAPESVRVKDTRFTWSSDNWDPREQTAELSETRAGWATSADSTCLIPNETSVVFAIDSEFSVALLDRGEPNAREGFAAFAQILTEDAASELAVLPGNVELLDMSRGETFAATLTSFVRTQSVCAEQEASGSSASLLDEYVGTWDGAWNFFTVPGSPGVEYVADFNLTISEEDDGSFSVEMTQKPSGERTAGRLDPVSMSFYAQGGDGYWEGFAGWLRVVDGQLHAAFVSIGGSENLAEEGPNVLAQYTGRIFEDGVVVLPFELFEDEGLVFPPNEPADLEALLDALGSLMAPDVDGRQLDWENIEYGIMSPDR